MEVLRGGYGRSPEWGREAAGGGWAAGGVLRQVLGQPRGPAIARDGIVGQLPAGEGREAGVKYDLGMEGIWRRRKGWAEAKRE